MAALAPGARLGPYEVTAPIGAGGMGEVYRARDTRLNRDVALKVLPAFFAADADRLARFAREAQVLAALNHPHIASIYGLEETSDGRALVLELVDGETLAARLGRGALPVAEALDIARQIASALDAAHEQGIIHRDLKPANVIINRSGVVKVLDFGLAKLSSPTTASASTPGLSQSPTFTSPALATHAGMLLGTAAYMSPEQARGRDSDRRADMWAFGCVLYEMLTGRQPFAGDTVTDVIAAVVTRDPDLSLLPIDTPAQVRWLLTRCFEKDPRNRFRDAADAASLLDAPAIMTAPAAPTAVGGRRRNPRMVAAAGAFAIVLIVAAAGIVGTRYLRPIPAPASPVVFEIPLTAAPINQAISISPDGRSIVYLTRTETRPMLTVRSLGELQPHLIAGTGGVSQFSQPFWSPDSHYIAFVADGKLKKIETNGSVPEVVAEVKTQFGGGTWGRDGTILFAANDHGVQSVSADGGPVTDVTTRDADDLYHDCPSLLPDGKRFLYLNYSDKPEKRAIYLAEIGSPRRTRLIASDTCPRLTDRYLLILRGQAVVARPFDADKGEFTGDAIPIIDGVATFANGELGVFDASTSGVLVYRKRPGEAANRRLMWMDRGGKASEPVGPPIRTGVIQLTADGRRVVFAEPTDETPDDLWAYDFVRNVKTRLTTDPAPDHNPVVSADGKRVAWDAHRTTTATIWERDIDGAGADRQISQPEAGLAWSPRAYSPDGRFLLFGKAPSGTPPWDLWVLPLTGERKAIPYATSRFDETAAVLSPDGRWVAYATDEPGSYQIVVQPFPDPSSGGKWQVSMSGGAFPRWRRDGKELYYIAPSGDLMAATVNAGPAFAIGATTKLFRTPFAWSGTPAGLGFPYDVATDGRFLFSAPTSDPNAQPITTVLNWSSLLKR